jgi:hypothetical protein
MELKREDMRGTAYPSGAPEFTPVFSEVRVARSFVFCAVLGTSLFVRLSFFFLPLYYLSFFDLRLLIIPCYSLPAPHVAPVVLLLLQIR